MLADDDVLLDDLAGVIDPTDARAAGGRAAPARPARRAAGWLTGRRRLPARSLAAVERVLAVAAGDDAWPARSPAGVRVERHRQRLRIVQVPSPRVSPAIAQ